MLLAWSSLDCQFSALMSSLILNFRACIRTTALAIPVPAIWSTSGYLHAISRNFNSNRVQPN